MAIQNPGNRAWHGPNGKFAIGNPGGPGNPHLRKVNALRTTLMTAIKPADIRAVVKALIYRAKNGDVAAAHEVFNRIFGKATQAIEAAISRGVDTADAEGRERFGRMLLQDNEFRTSLLNFYERFAQVGEQVTGEDDGLVPVVVTLQDGGPPDTNGRGHAKI